MPLVQLETTNSRRFWTDSAGYIAFDEPGMMNREVFFTITSHGYEYPADGFGIHGMSLTPKRGGTATINIKRINIAERLYRITGEGIYRDSILLGQKPPIDEPLINSSVVGQDSNLAAVYRDKIYWFWGDTGPLLYPLGNFQTTAGATSDLPGKGAACVTRRRREPALLRRRQGLHAAHGAGQRTRAGLDRRGDDVEG